MKNLFNIENPVFQFLARVCDLMILNILFVLCCLPIVTVGASISAMQKVTQDIILDEDSGIFKRFFQVFAANFKQSTIVWLMQAVFLAGMVGNTLLVFSYFTSLTAKILLCLIAFLVALVLSIFAYLYPLIVRYNNTLKQHIYNAVILSIAKFPRTLLMLVIDVFPILILYFSSLLFIKTLVFWIVIGFAFVSYMHSWILKPVFLSLEAKQLAQEEADEDGETEDTEESEEE